MTPVLDAGPLIYLAKLDALDVFAEVSPGLVSDAVRHETLRPELAFRFPETARIAGALDRGWLVAISPTDDDRSRVDDLRRRAAGLHDGELEVLALGLRLGHPVCLHERQALRLAAALGLDVTHVVELLFERTHDLSLLERRLRTFARLTALAIDDLGDLLTLAREDHR